MCAYCKQSVESVPLGRVKLCALMVIRLLRSGADLRKSDKR